MDNGTMMQYFEWYLPSDSSLWRKAVCDAKNLYENGISAVWLPPAYKGNGGVNDVGYATYDLYDLGEFDQKGSIPTKYGTKDEYLNAINAFHSNNIQVYADIVLDHKIGADSVEKVFAVEDSCNDRNKEIGCEREILAWTKFTFAGRNNKYSDFTWNVTHFNGIDWDDKTKRKAIFEFEGKQWDTDVDTSENGNYDYLMGADLDLDNPEVPEELTKWGRWYLEMTKVDGFRIDAAKHICYNFFDDWLAALRHETGKELFTVGEYWHTNVDNLINYINKTNGAMSLFDVPLHFNFCKACCCNGNFDMKNILRGSLTERYPTKSVSFVDNHDSQPGQALQSWVLEWFKPLAYALILLRQEGYPCVFYGDYYGIPNNNISPVKNLDKLIKLRKEVSYGKQNDYFDNNSIIGWTREGDSEHQNSGMAVIMSDNIGGNKKMYVGLKFAGTMFYDCLGNMSGLVSIGSDGCGVFLTDGGSVSVWVKKA